ncbi:TonB-dependent receptor [Luteimonas salinilitoris]|uniref:TonB-dependent receptor n=1 Tax=Luteimonas salinilitoris TaxID=3237697 RepID=A0ABV4HQ99_9GAMM
MKLERNLLSVALSSAMLMFAANVNAQTAGEDDTPAPAAQGTRADDAEAVDLDRVTVTGIRRGIENAIETKQSSTSIVESISAEDIGKLPDISIAESIARLPGLAAQRVAGRSSTISIRGLAENFGTTLLNGREQVSLGHNRGVEFDQYPSELINAVVVYKTPDASLVGQGLSGTVDLQTVRPLSFGERVITFNARAEENSLGELNPGYDDRGYRISGSYIDQFMDGRLGVAVGYARMDSPGQANRWESWGYPTDNAGSPGNFLLGGSKSQASSVENVRDGLMAVVEFKASDNWTSILDAYYSTFDKSETLRFMETGLAWGAGTTLSNAVVEDGQVVSGTFSGVRPVLRNDRNTQEDELLAVGWNNAFEFGERWSGVADLSYSKAERKEMLLETYSGLGSASNTRTDTVDFVIDRSSGLPTFTYREDYTDPSNLVLTDPGGWGQEGFIKFPEVEDRLASLRLGAERRFDAGIFSSVEFGVNHADREKTRRSGLEAFLRLPDGEVPIPADALTAPVDLGFTGIRGSIGYDTGAVLPLYVIDEHSHSDIRNKNWTVEEKLSTAYAQWNLNTDVGEVALRGNIGVQLVHTDQSSTGFVVPFGDADAPIPMSGGAQYNDVLPSLNLSFGFPSDQMLRFALGRQMARPRMDDLRANRNISIRTDRDPNGQWTGDGGNPELEPWRATALDVSYEKYFGGRGYFSLAAFHKDLHSYIYKRTVNDYDFSEFDPRGFDPVSDLGEFTTPENGQGGELYGFEAAVSVPLDMLWQPLDGFGVIASYSKTKSSILPEGPDGPDRSVPGLSEHVSNVTLYYERQGFSTRVSRRSRSPFIGDVVGFGGDLGTRYIGAEDIVDFQVGYAFADGTRLEGLSVLLQVNNVTNEEYREFYFDNGLAQTYNEYGRQVLLGLNYKF